MNQGSTLLALETVQDPRTVTALVVTLDEGPAALKVALARRVRGPRGRDEVRQGEGHVDLDAAVEIIAVALHELGFLDSCDPARIISAVFEKPLDGLYGCIDHRIGIGSR